MGNVASVPGLFPKIAVSDVQSFDVHLCDSESHGEGRGKVGLKYSVVIFNGLVASSVLLLFGSGLGQENVHSVTDVLSKAHVSGSLAYWSPGVCRPEPSRFPSFPRMLPTRYSGLPLGALSEMFAGDPKMRVTQEPGGVVRMSETDVPNDLLDVRIHHISFDLSRFGPVVFGGPNMELQKILLAPEVQAFKSVHNIGPFSGFRLPGDATSYNKHVPGELNDVTVSQALDYVLLTFPGYWVYGNCTNEKGGREAFFWFIENIPETPPISDDGVRITSELGSRWLSCR